MKEFLINNRGSIEDIRCSLKLGMPDIDHLRRAITDEKKNQNRDTVLKMLANALKKQLKK